MRLRYYLVINCTTQGLLSEYEQYAGWQLVTSALIRYMWPRGGKVTRGKGDMKLENMANKMQLKRNS